MSGHDEDVTFEDAEGQGGYSVDKLTFKTIMLEHYRSIAKLGLREWFGGYWNEKTMLQAGVIVTNKVYVEDSRMMFVNGVGVLADLLIPHFDTVALRAYERAEQAYAKLEHEQSATKYRHDAVLIAKELFKDLNFFLKRKNYFESKRTSDSKGAK